MGNADGGNPEGKRGWQWVMVTVLVTAMVTVFVQGLSRSATAAIELLGDASGGIVLSDRFSACSYFPSGAASTVLGASDSLSDGYR